MRKRIILVSPLAPPPGGIATWTLNLLTYFKLKGNLNSSLQLIHISNARRFGSITERRLFFRVSSGILNATYFLFRLLVNLRIRKNQLIHLTSSGSFSLLKDLIVAFIFKLCGGEVLLHIRFGRVPKMYAEKKIDYMVFKILAYLSDKIIAIDKPTFSLLNDKLGEKVIFLPNPVSDFFLDNASRLEVSSKFVSNISILFVGHVIKEKGIYDLIEAIGNTPNINLRVAGYASDFEKEKVINYAIKYSRLNLTFLGNLGTNELIQELNSCTLFCLPSHTEGFPNAVLEAMACGVPIVVSDVGEIPVMVNNNGKMAAWLFRANDVASLKQALDSAISNNEERINRGNLARDKVLNNYTSNKIFSELQKIWLS